MLGLILRRRGIIMFFRKFKRGEVAADNLIWWILTFLLVVFAGAVVVRIFG